MGHPVCLSRNTISTLKMIQPTSQTRRSQLFCVNIRYAIKEIRASSFLFSIVCVQKTWSVDEVKHEVFEIACTIINVRLYSAFIQEWRTCFVVPCFLTINVNLPCFFIHYVTKKKQLFGITIINHICYSGFENKTSFSCKQAGQMLPNIGWWTYMVPCKLFLCVNYKYFADIMSHKYCILFSYKRQH